MFDMIFVTTAALLSWLKDTLPPIMYGAMGFILGHETMRSFVSERNEFFLESFSEVNNKKRKISRITVKQDNVLSTTTAATSASCIHWPNALRIRRTSGAAATALSTRTSCPKVSFQGTIQEGHRAARKALLNIGLDPKARTYADLPVTNEIFFFPMLCRSVKVLCRHRIKKCTM